MNDVSHLHQKRKQLFRHYISIQRSFRKVSLTSVQSLPDQQIHLCNTKTFNPDASIQIHSRKHAPLYNPQNVTHSTYANQPRSNWLIPFRHPKSMQTIVQLFSNYLSQICAYIKLPKGVTYCAHLNNLCVHNWDFWSSSNLVSNTVQQHPLIWV